MSSNDGCKICRQSYRENKGYFSGSRSCSDWNPATFIGNPAASSPVKRHLKSVKLEQSSAEVTTKQAIPFMFDKLARLCRYLTYKMSVEKNPTGKYLLARDRSFFAMLCHSGSRGGDLGRLTAHRLFELPNSEGILVSQIVGKVVSSDNQKCFALMPSKHADICPVKFVKAYFEVAHKAGLNLGEGHLFRARDSKTQSIVDKPVSSTPCLID